VAPTVTIAGVDATQRVAVNSLRLNERLNTRSRLSLLLHEVPYTLTTEADEILTTEVGEALESGFAYPQVGSVITLSQELGLLTEAEEALTTELGEQFTTETEPLFGGFVDSVSEELTIDGNQTSLDLELECVSYDAIADRHLVAARYDASPQDLGDIVDDIIANVLTGEGITVSYGSPLPPIGKVQWNYSTAAAVFDDLATLTGWAWWIDANRVLQFQPRAAIAAPFNVGPTNARKVRVQRTTEVYRNRQLIRAGKGLTVSRTENFTGDGTRKTFTLAYPVGSGPTDTTPPTITVGGVGKSVGIRGVATPGQFDWLYNVDDANVSQDDGAAAVGAGVTIAVTYRGQYPILIQSQDDSEISSQAALGGGAGIFEAIDERAALNTIEGAQDAAAGLLRRFGKIPRRVTFETDTAGLRAGQLLQMAFTPHNVSGSWLIDLVSASDRNGKELVWTVEALDGESIGGWETFFSELARAGRVIEFRENEVVVLLRAPSETITLTDATTWSSAAQRAGLGLPWWASARWV
jgi:hypothetical protein